MLGLLGNGCYGYVQASFPEVNCLPRCFGVDRYSKVKRNSKLQFLLSAIDGELPVITLFWCWWAIENQVTDANQTWKLTEKTLTLNLLEKKLVDNLKKTEKTKRLLFGDRRMNSTSLTLSRDNRRTCLRDCARPHPSVTDINLPPTSSYCRHRSHELPL